MKSCKQCSTAFEFSELERAHLKEVSPIVAGQALDIPEPTLCTSCRRQRRYAVRNDHRLYRRNCSKSGRTILSVFSKDTAFPVYGAKEWWEDDWDARDYGQDFDFSRPFFDQFLELQNKVPRIASMVVKSENSDYTAFTLDARNCYLSYRLADVQDIYYTYLAFKSNNCFDCYGIGQCELCYECIDCSNCYHCFFTEKSKNCSDLYFCLDMLGCKNCFGCVGLVQQEYCFFNQRLSKEEYEKRVKEWTSEPDWVARTREAFEEHAKRYAVRALNIYNSENANGSYIFDSKNVWNSFDIMESEDVINCTQDENCKDIMDTDFGYYGELSYDQISNGRSSRIIFGFCNIGSNDLMYCIDAYNGTQDCFGCISMRKQQYCILNKQYPKEEYEALVPRIVEHMKSTGEWGEFFPIENSATPYNESIAQDFYPQSKEAVLAQGWKWRDTEEELMEAGGEDVMHCEVSGRPYRLLPKEIEFYKQNGLPLPLKHPDVRHEDRLRRRNPYLLRNSHCRKCNKEVVTDQEESLMIYCRECYLAEVY